MKHYVNPTHRALIQLCYLLPAIFGILLMVYAAVPHLWFVYNGEAYSTMNLFELQENAWDFYVQVQSGAIESNEAVVWFEELLPVVSALFWILPILYAILTLAITVCSIVAFSFDPTTRIANRTKRILHMVCPNRVTYLLLDDTHNATPMREEIFTAEHFSAYLTLKLYDTYLIRIEAL